MCWINSPTTTTTTTTDVHLNLKDMTGSELFVSSLCVCHCVPKYPYCAMNPAFVSLRILITNLDHVCCTSERRSGATFRSRHERHPHTETRHQKRSSAVFSFLTHVIVEESGGSDTIRCSRKEPPAIDTLAEHVVDSLMQS